MESPNSVRYFQKLNEMVKELASETKGEKMPFHDVHGVYPARKCIVCGKTFIPKTANHKVCSPECSKKRASELKPLYRKATKKTPSVSNMDEIREIARRGVHYGQYVAEAEGRVRREDAKIH